LTTTRSKRWNGKLETLAADFIAGVLAQMETYGGRVQFALSTPGARPNYQVLNDADKKMAFDANHHLLQPQAAEFEGSNATAILTLEDIRAIGTAKPKAKSAAKSGKRAVRTTTASAKAADLVDAAKYAYFRANRQTLPPAIGGHSDEISTLMRNGLSAEDAFSEVLKRHF
jgi:hypothetical protein